MAKMTSIILDCNFSDDPKFETLIEKYGYERTFSRFIRLITALGSEGGQMPRKQVDLLGRKIGLKKEDWIDFISSCLEEGLITQEADLIKNNRLVRDYEKTERRRETWRKSKGIHKDSTRNPQGVNTNSKNLTKEPEPEEEKEEEIIKKKIVSLDDVPNIKIPPELSSVQHQAALERLLAHKHRMKKPFKHQDSFQTFLNRWAKRPAEFLNAVDEAIAAEWEGLPWDKDYTERALFKRRNGNVKKTLEEELEEIARM